MVLQENRETDESDEENEISELTINRGGVSAKGEAATYLSLGLATALGAIGIGLTQMWPVVKQFFVYMYILYDILFSESSDSDNPSD